MRIDLQPAYVLHARPFKDSSAILDCITRDFGRISLLAKGARSAKSGQRQLCQPFVPLWVSWQGKNDLKTLVGIEASGLPILLQGERLFSGLYLNELCVRLLAERDVCTDTYYRYERALASLAGDDELEPLLRVFELGLLNDMGYAVDLQHDAAGQYLEEGAQYIWRDQQGWEMRVSSSEGFSGASLLAIGRGDYSERATRRQAKALTRMLLRPLLGNRPLQSRKLFS